MSETARIKRVSGRSTDISCSCSTCKSMCRTNVCIGTPSDVLRLINNGLIDNMSGTTYLAGLLRGVPPVHMIQLQFHKDRGCCVMLDDRGLCTLHSSGLKPTEGKLAGCTPPDHKPKIFLTDAVALTWYSKENERTIDLIVKAYTRFNSHKPCTGRAIEL